MQESYGTSTGTATFEDLLQNPHDEDLYEYYATSQVASVEIETGKVTPLGKPGIIEGINLSPNGKDMLVTREHRPFSYLHPNRQFPKEVEIWTHPNAGAMVHKVVSLPLQERTRERRRADRASRHPLDADRAVDGDVGGGAGRRQSAREGSASRPRSWR